MESEFLARISERQRVFLTRTAVLERMCGPLCEAVLELPGSAATLADLARSNLLLVPLDRRGQWYRYHHLFRDMLLAELERLEPGLIPVLRRRAAAWCLRNDLPEEALEYSMAAGDVDHGWPGWWRSSGCRPTGRAGSPPCSGGSGGWMTGAGSRATRWPPCGPRFVAMSTGGRPRPSGGPTRSIAGSYRRRGPAPMTRPPRPGPLVLRAVLCRDGVEQMRADADEAARRFAAAEHRGAGGRALARDRAHPLR